MNNLECTDTEILDWYLSFVMKNNRKMNYICLKLSNKNTLKENKMTFPISITKPSSLSNVYNYYTPRLTGEIYRRIIPKGYVTVFQELKVTTRKIRWNKFFKI